MLKDNILDKAEISVGTHVTTDSDASVKTSDAAKVVPASSTKNSPISRREKNKLRTRANILTAARSRFGKAGIAATTMDEIADLADVSRGTLFNYFSSKAEIVAALVRELNINFLTILGKACESDATIEERIITIFTESAHYLEMKAVLARRLVDPAEQGWATVNADNVIVHQLVAGFERLLSTAKDSDQLRQDVSPARLGELILGIYSGLVHMWRINEKYELAAHLTVAAGLAAELVTAGKSTKSAQSA